MPSASRSLLRRSGSALLSLVLLCSGAALGTAALMRLAPGYFSDERELDAQYGASAQAALAREQHATGSVVATCLRIAGGWLRLDFGISRTWQAPVADVVRERVGSSSRLLGEALLLSWSLALGLALPYGARFFLAFEAGALSISAFALALPGGALATFCIVFNHGGPVAVLAILITARTFRYLHAALSRAWKMPHVLLGRASGLSYARLLRLCILPQITPHLLPLAGLSIVTALSAIVPVEVLFDQPGLGKLAWQASLNRDLPVLVAITLLFALAVGAAGALSPAREPLS